MSSNFNTKFSLPSFLRQVRKLKENQRESIKRAGFGNLLHIPEHVLRRCQLNHLMETWNSEKQAFVFPAGEIKITLLDVSLILGLRVIGEPVVLLEDLPLSNLEKEFGASFSKRAISLNTLKEKLDSLGERHDESFVRVFLLYCFGTLLFPSANGKVDSRFLHLLENVDAVSSFAWGAAVLGDLHEYLSKRKSKKTNDVGGCLILLQIWCYEHIVIGRPKLLNCIFPRACRWERCTKRYVTSPIKFEELEHTQIIWKLQPTSMETLIDIIREIPKEWYLRTGPGTIEQPIEVQTTVRRVRVYREEDNLTRQQNSVIFLLSDDEESLEPENLQEEILEERIENDDVLRKRLEDENNELRKKVQDEEELRRRVEKKLQDEEELRRRVEKKVQDAEELGRIVLKKLQDEEELRKRSEAETVELRKENQYQKEVIKTLQDDYKILKNSAEQLGKENRLLDGCFSDLAKVFSNDNVDL